MAKLAKINEITQNLKVKKWFKGGLKVKGWKSEKVKKWLRRLKVKGWKSEKMAAPLKGERVKKWKGEKVKGWKSEKVKNGCAY